MYCSSDLDILTGIVANLQKHSDQNKLERNTVSSGVISLKVVSGYGEFSV